MSSGKRAVKRKRLGLCWYRLSDMLACYLRTGKVMGAKVARPPARKQLAEMGVEEFFEEGLSESESDIDGIEDVPAPRTKYRDGKKKESKSMKRLANTWLLFV